MTLDHDHDWVNVTTLGDRYERYICTAIDCHAEREVLTAEDLHPAAPWNAAGYDD